MDRKKIKEKYLNDIEEYTNNKLIEITLIPKLVTGGNINVPLPYISF